MKASEAKKLTLDAIYEHREDLRVTTLPELMKEFHAKVDEEIEDYNFETTFYRDKRLTNDGFLREMFIAEIDNLGYEVTWYPTHGTLEIKWS
jgi:hypothetical protein